MFIGDVNARSREQVLKFRQLTYTCMENSGTRAPETLGMSGHPAPFHYPELGFDGDTRH